MDGRDAGGAEGREAWLADAPARLPPRTSAGNANVPEYADHVSPAARPAIHAMTDTCLGAARVGAPPPSDDGLLNAPTERSVSSCASATGRRLYR